MLVINNHYLYGDHVPAKISKDVIKNRVDILNVQLTKELDINYRHRDVIKVNKLINAIDFWERINDAD